MRVASGILIPNIYSISGSVTYYFRLTNDASSIVFDLNDTLSVDSVLMHQSHISFLQNNNKTLTVVFAQKMAQNGTDSLTIYYHGTPASNGFGSFAKDIHNGNVPIIWTLSEPYGARDWFPCRNGLDDKIDSLDIYITHPSQYCASANGLLLETSTNNNYTTTHFKHRYPIATYLIGIAVTNYTTVTSEVKLQNGTLPVTTTVYPEFLIVFSNLCT